MSGIVGVFFRNGSPVDTGSIERMLARIIHRGPDKTTIWQEGSVGLGACALWTTPEARLREIGCVSADGALVIAADARIDNRQELFSELGLARHQVDDLGAEEIILHAYRKWGYDCVEHLVGDFAFALWDAQKNCLFCARDQIGVKPFYYFLAQGFFVLASEIKALLALAEVPRELNEKRVADHLTGSFGDNAITFYEHIYRLPPAHMMIVGTTNVKRQRYWSLDAKKEIRYASQREYEAAFRSVFEVAVKARMRTAYPLGYAMSGGLDSSAIFCTARKIQGDDLQAHMKTFTADYSALPAGIRHFLDEQEYVNQVLNGGEVGHVQVNAVVSPLLDVGKILAYMDEPVYAPNLSMHWVLFRAAAQAGVRVYLDGVDGDETVSHGLERLAGLAWKFAWPALLSEARALSSRFVELGKPSRILWRYGVRPLIPEPVVTIGRKLRRREPRWKSKLAILDQDFARRINYEERLSAFAQRKTKGVPVERAIHWQRLSDPQIALSLEWLDKIASANSLEIWTRAILRRSMAGVLPEPVRWRTTKADFRFVFLWGFLHFEKQRIERVLFHENSMISPYVNLDALRTSYRRYLREPLRHLGAALDIYSAIILNAWLECASQDR